MKIVYPLLFGCFLQVMITGAQAQKPSGAIRLKEGSIAREQILNGREALLRTLPGTVFNKKIYAVAEFSHLPGPEEKAAMAKKGIILSAFISGRAFQIELPDSLEAAELLSYQVTGIYKLPPSLKIAGALQKRLKDNTFHTTADNPVAISYYGNLSSAEVKSSLERLGARIMNTRLQIPGVIFIEAGAGAIQQAAQLPFVNYIMQQPLKDVPLNYNNRSKHALEALGSASGRNLQGKNVTIGMGDDATPIHVDFSGRLITRTYGDIISHGTHTTGTAAGAGILNPVNKGMAPKATIISKFCSDVLIDAPVYIADNNMVLTNNSYYSGIAGCTGNGEYNFLSTYVDYQLNYFPSLLHVFASGNDGGLTCTPFPRPYGTIKSGFQCAKNALTVGNLYGALNTILSTSSSGPVDDGRIKPEIVAGGTSIISTVPNNNYGGSTGTSMSAPTVTGTLALLYERYRQLHGGIDPPGALIKAIACNSAVDMGNPGPDFIYGFGALNARKAVETIEEGRFISGTINNGGSFSQMVTLPSGAHQVKIMLYWSDPESAPGAPVTLVNNLDLKVTTPSSVVRLPLVLNPAPGSVSNNATETTDYLNNIEQVVIDAPASGNYTVTIEGTSIPAGPQTFYVVYEILSPSVTVEYPFAGETLVPGQTENIRWNAVGGDGNTFTIEYSPDNGSNWSLITNAALDTVRSYAWVVPSSATNNGLIRVTRNNAGYTGTSNQPFTILGQPVLSSVTNPCEGSVALSWSTITDATGYEVMTLDGDSMKTIATTASTSYLVSGLDKNKLYWFAVRAVNGANAGRRSVAASIQPSGGDCSLPAFDNDFSIDTVLSPYRGRMFTASQLGAAEDITIRLKNLGSSPSAGSVTVHYQINGGAIVSETVPAVLPAHSSVNYPFTTKANFSATGTYTLKAWVDYVGDPYPVNDTATAIIKQLSNAPLALNPSFTEGFESASGGSYTGKITGVDGLDRCDFTASNSNGRMSTFMNSGYARTGNRCITLDQVIKNSVASADSLVTTFNLSSYTLADNILLNFYYKNHGINFSLPGNAVWIRGSETSDWIQVFTLPVSTSDIGGYRASPAINITEALAAAIPAQTFSSSFQVKLGENGYKPVNSPDAPGINVDNGFSFDDVTLVRTLNDVSVTTIQQPSLPGVCTLTASEIIRVTVKNSGSTDLTNIPVRYKIDATTVSENIPFIAANTSIVYDFATPADLSVFKAYQLQIWTDFAGDTYHLNDTITTQFRTSPVIAAFPYQEGFESNEGYWYSGGINSSWQWGIPAKPVISAAAGGMKAWVTGIPGNYNNSEYSFLYSPCFNLSGLVNPTLAFSHIYRTEDNCDPGICDTHWMEYSTDDIVWTKLGTNGSGSNWYDDVRLLWKASRPLWHESVIALPVAPSKFRLRFVMASDPALNYDGVGVDNIRVFDSSNTVLPVTLLSFKATKENDNARLYWSTSSETNTAQFIVQKSTDGNDYSDIGTIRAANAGNLLSEYRFTDYNLGSGTSFYRLKMMDRDGSYTYSAVRSIHYEVQAADLQIYPNPVTEGIVYINASVDCSLITLNDITGRTIKTEKVKGLRPTLSVTGVTEGTYFITVTTSEGKRTRKIIIR